MNTSDIIAIASFSISIAGIVFFVGKNAQRLSFVEKDLNGLGTKIENRKEAVDKNLTDIDNRLDNQEKFMTLTAERLVNLKERLFGEDITAGRRE